MLTRLREIVEKVASAPRLNEALNILVTDICLAMETEVCSVYLADHDRRCYYLMATRGLKKPRGRTVTLAFDEGIVGLVGRLAEPINLADAQKHPSFKYIPSVKEERFRAFLGVPIIQRRQLLGVLVVQQRELRQYDESEESFLVTLATQMAAILSQSQLAALFGQYRHTRIRALPASPGVAIAEGWMDATLPLMGRSMKPRRWMKRLSANGLPLRWKRRRMSFVATANALPLALKKRRRPFSTSTHTCFPMRVCVVSYLPRSIKVRWQSGRLKRSLKNLPSSLRC